MADYPVTYCNNGKEAIMRMTSEEVYVAPHGADHADFAPLDPKKRKHLRELVGWDDKFVIMNIGTNKRSKQQPYLVRMLEKLIEMGHEDVLLYLHTKSFDNHVMQGWDLEWYIACEESRTGLSLSDKIMFPETLKKWHGTPWKYDDDFDLDSMSVPPSPEKRGGFFLGLDYITRIGLADVYVDPSSAEGWGLTPLEAVACGVPAISVEDGMARSEYHSKYCFMVDPVHYSTWHTSTDLLLVDPLELAFAVEYIMENPPEPVNEKLLKDLPWEPTAQFFVEMIRKAYKEKV